MTENKMFCFQCQETAKGTGCTIKGVCGKEATTSKWQDLLLSVVRGIGTIQHSIGKEPTPEVTRFLTDALIYLLQDILVVEIGVGNGGGNRRRNSRASTVL
jgi:hydroxylamine reductase (hybrid-cluster protein)